MKRHRIFFILLAFAVILAGCGNNYSPLDANSQNTDEDRGGPQSVATISSATLHVFVGTSNGQTVYVHNILTDWVASSVTWSSFGEAYSADIKGSFVPGSSGWYSVDVTDVVQQWASGETASYGLLLLQQDPAPAPVSIHSSEAFGFMPFIEVCQDLPSGIICDTLSPTGDAFIDEYLSNQNFGDATVMYVNQHIMAGRRKQALISFNITDIIQSVETAEIGGRVWDDLDQDGIQEAGETGIADVAVSLYDCTDQLLQTTTTDGMGLYSFDSLGTGDYRIECTAPESYEFSPADQEPTDTLDSDFDPTTGNTPCFSVGDNEQSLHWDAGTYEIVDEEEGCTRGKGYWKNQLRRGTVASQATSLLPIWLGEEHGEMSLLVDEWYLAFWVLSEDICWKRSNGISKLYSQLLAAKLNIANGANDDDISETILRVDQFLAEHDCQDWEYLSGQEKKDILSAKDLLEDYNRGEIGPGSCDEESNNWRAGY